jgi:hypothetical protein
MRRRRRTLPSAATCDRHMAKAMRDITPPDGDTADTHVLVRRLDTPNPAYRCACGVSATWFLTTEAVVR